MPLAVRMQREAAFGERLFHTDRGERVLQNAPRWNEKFDRQWSSAYGGSMEVCPHVGAGPAEGRRKTDTI